MVKCYAQEKRVFDINKVTVVGSPSISEDGVASGFSSKSSGIENYLTFPTVFNPASNTWKIIIKATTGEWTSNIPFASLLGSGIQGVGNQGVALAITNNQISCWLRSNTGTGWDIGNIRTTFTYTTGETYYFQIEFTGTKYVLSVSKDRKNWEIKGSIESSLPIYVSTQPLAIGDNKYNNSASTCWTGSIDLMETYVYIGDQVFFNPTKPTYLLERRKEGFDLSKFTVVGSPTIVDGVASGFSKGNYLDTLTSISGKWAIKCSVNCSNVTENEFGNGIITTNLSAEKMFLSFRNSGVYLHLAGEADIMNGYLAGVTVLDNTNYDIELGFTGDVYYLKLNGEQVWSKSSNESTNTSGVVQIGTRAFNRNAYFRGSIDLKQFSITVDGKEVFTGAKEKFYAMQGGI